MGDADAGDPSLRADECSNTGLLVTVAVLVVVIVVLVCYIVFIKNAKFNAVVHERAEHFLTIAPIARRSRIFRQSCLPDDFVRNRSKTVTFHDQIAEVDVEEALPPLDEDAEVWDCEVGADGHVAAQVNGARCEKATDVPQSQ